VECPNSTDVIFRLGTAVATHPGNARFRSLIQSKYEEYISVRYDKDGNDKLLLQKLSALSSYPTTTTTTIDIHMTTKQFVLILIKETLQNSYGGSGGRFLTWKALKKDDGDGKNGLLGYWTELTDEKQIFSKIEFIVNDFKYSNKKPRTYNCSIGSCSGGSSNNGNSSGLGNKMVTNRTESNFHDRDHQKATSFLQDKSKVTTTTSTILQSDTSVFQCQDGCEQNRFCGNVKNEYEEINSSTMEPNTTTINTTTTTPEECFGLKFFSHDGNTF